MARERKHDDAIDRMAGKERKKGTVRHTIIDISRATGHPKMGVVSRPL